MLIQGLRVHIAGSADSSTNSEILCYAHELVTELVRTLILERAMFVTGIGKEPLSIENNPNSPPIVFDWTVLHTIYECWQQGFVKLSDFPERLVYTVGTSKTDNQIPDSRRDLWESLLAVNAVEIDFLPPGWTAGFLRRERQAQRGDILIIIGGGQGVEQTAHSYMEKGKPVIPLDLQIGSSCNDGNGGASSLAMQMLNQPERFVRISNSSAVGSLVAGFKTRQGKEPVKKVVQAIVKLIYLLEPPSIGNQIQSSTNGNQKVLSPLMQKILILAAIPGGLHLDKEIREIEEAIRRAVRREQFEIKIRTAVRPQDIRRAIAEERPFLVHFCGHGLENGDLVLEDDGGNHKPVSPEALAALFKLHTDYVNCVLINACYSEKLAEAISEYIDYVIGMNEPIGDTPAIKFAQGFYDGLGYENLNNQGDLVQRAFDEGLISIQLEEFSHGAIPVFKKKLNR